MAMTELEQHYNKFNEEKRLDSRHGQVEYITSMKYIHKYIDSLKKETGCGNAGIKILDIGAGTGRYTGKMIWNGLRVALAMFRGKIILNFGVQESLRTFLNPIFTERVIGRRHIIPPAV